MFKRGDIVKVLIPNSINKGYDYYLCEDASLGAIVKVNVSNSKYLGVIIEKSDGLYPKDKIKNIISVIKNPENNKILSLSNKDILWIKKMAKLNILTEGAVLKLILNIGNIFQNLKLEYYYSFNNQNIKISKKQQEVKNLLEDNNPRTIKNIISDVPIGKVAIENMIKKGLLIKKTSRLNSDFSYNYQDTGLIKLNEEQIKATNIIDKNILGNIFFQVFLINGITGSGKTQVYFDSVLKIYKKGFSVLIMMPEISLTAQFIKKFEERFGSPPVIWHSNLTNHQRKSIWEGVITEKIRIIIGTRSALFLPWQNLGLIVIDEEHDSSYKQEENVIYHARDMAILKASINNIPVILASATPSFETINNVNIGKYTLINLNSRYGNANLPLIEIVDLRKEKIKYYDNNKKSFISEKLNTEIKKALDNKYQVMLFINRRGYSPSIQCEKCGNIKKCDDCDVGLTYHKKTNKLLCHLCGKSYNYNDKCNECGNNLILQGAGLEKIEEEVKYRFPTAKTKLISSDIVNSSILLKQIISDIENKKIDIIIGTQILTKGHHFPNINLVGVIDSDMGIFAPDFRASEKAYQQLVQVAGRSGRGDIKGKVLFQTYNPEHTIFKTILEENDKKFIEQELEKRKLAKMPPFGQLIAIIIEATNEDKLNTICRKLLNDKPILKDAVIMGPIDSDIYKIRKWYRKRFLVISNLKADLSDILLSWLSNVKKSSYIRIKIDATPHNFV